MEKRYGTSEYNVDNKIKALNWLTKLFDLSVAVITNRNSSAPGAYMQQRISAVGVSVPKAVYRTVKDIYFLPVAAFSNLTYRLLSSPNEILLHLAQICSKG